MMSETKWFTPVTNLETTVRLTAINQNKGIVVILF